MMTRAELIKDLYRRATQIAARRSILPIVQSAMRLGEVERGRKPYVPVHGQYAILGDKIEARANFRVDVSLTQAELVILVKGETNDD